MESNLSCVLYGPNDIRMEDRSIPLPGKHEVQIRMNSVGICGSDVHYWKHGRIGDFVLTSPMVLGHESSGTVSALGENVTSLKVGDRVAIEPGVPCRMCDFCKTGKYNLCPDIVFCATPPIDGTLANYYVHPADFCYKLPDHVSFEEGALLEPLAVGVHACRRAGVGIGKRVLICGAGPIGLVSLLTAKAMGAAEVCITDIDGKRLDFAQQLGANHTVLVQSDGQPATQQVEAAFGDRPDISIECSGAESSIRLAIYATKSGGTVVLVGLGAPDVMLPIVNASTREVDIRGIFRYANCYPTALDMVASGQVNAKALITHHFTLAESINAFEAAHAGAGIKVMIHCEQ